MIKEFAKYKNVKGIPKTPVKGDWAITNNDDIVKILKYNKYYDFYNVEYPTYDNEKSAVKLGILKHFGTKEDMEIILQSKKYNL